MIYRPIPFPCRNDSLLRQGVGLGGSVERPPACHLPYATTRRNGLYPGFSLSQLGGQ
ncbi:hypothetical protein L288_20325 [Sphingobium quisquiliarum P25]|uniref:Uncharacterized protein n=1 Tax=Sphingobium quisquiliarum P25 TaxID=1329909 RepID=T0GDE5_9SPHN|nr:hypothetical protein L288_20325 [Sphingobium quisquiliarum P25]